MTYLDKIAGRVRENLPEEARPPGEADALFLLYAVLVRAKGETTTMSDVHDAWAAWQLTVDADHTALVPFDYLEPAVQEADRPYLSAIHRTAREHAGDA